MFTEQPSLWWTRWMGAHGFRGPPPSAGELCCHPCSLPSALYGNLGGSRLCQQEAPSFGSLRLPGPCSGMRHNFRLFQSQFRPACTPSGSLLFLWFVVTWLRTAHPTRSMLWTSLNPGMENHRRRCFRSHLFHPWLT